MFTATQTKHINPVMIDNLDKKDFQLKRRAKHMADALTMSLGHLLIKALGDPDDMFWWEKRYGGKLPDPKANRSMDITEWIINNPKIVDAYLRSNGQPRVVDYPLEANVPIPEWDEVQDSLTGADAGLKPREYAPYSKTRKMPGPSFFDTPPRACVYSTPNDPNTACGHCYACQGTYALNSPQARIWNNLDKVLNNPEAFGSAVAHNLTPSAMLERGSRKDQPVVRFKAAGDLMGAGELALISNVMEENPSVNGWLSTRQIPFIQQFLDARGWEDDAFPENLAVKVSLPGKSDFNNLSRPLRELGKHPAIDFTNYDNVVEGASVCPASLPGNPAKCDKVIDPLTNSLKCRNCFRRGSNITYLDHDNPSISNEEMEIIWQLLNRGQ